VFSQGKDMRDHESVHLSKQHVATIDPNVRASQAFAKTKGRPSIQEIDKRATAPSSKKKGKAAEAEPSSIIDKFAAEAEAEEQESVDGELATVDVVEEATKAVTATEAEEMPPPEKRPKGAATSPTKA
jgi:flagellar motility protein MotE (MotC chaperone)